MNLCDAFLEKSRKVFLDKVKFSEVKRRGRFAQQILSDLDGTETIEQCYKKGDEIGAAFSRSLDYFLLFYLYYTSSNASILKNFIKKCKTGD